MKFEKISVVMSVYKNDNVSFFKEAIESLLQQTYLPSEIVIVIDGDVGKEIDYLLAHYKSNKLFNIIRLTENKGLANALNIGVLTAQYNLIARMDSDDICFADRFEKQLGFMNEFDLDVIGGQIIEFGKDTEDIISKRIVPCSHEEMVQLMKFRSPFSHPTILFKKEVFEALKGYDTTIFPEDYDFFVRAYLKGFKFGNVEDEVLWFRLGENYSDTIKRRWGVSYAKHEFKLYKKFLKINFYNQADFTKAVLLKIPLRLLPFFVFKFIYFKLSR
jgi:glycosyltransferase involved in cell wall biosynthesis